MTVINTVKQCQRLNVWDEMSTTRPLTEAGDSDPVLAPAP